MGDEAQGIISKHINTQFNIIYIFMAFEAPHFSTGGTRQTNSEEKREGSTGTS